MTIRKLSSDSFGGPDASGVPLSGQGAVGPQSNPAGDPELPAAALELDRLVRAVTRFISLEQTALPDEFFPAHLPVALIDAVFCTRLEKGDQVPPCAERYCLRFEIEAVRSNQWEFPRVEVQESLGDLVTHFEELGTQSMADEVFQTRQTFPRGSTPRVDLLLLAARELRRIGIDVLQDVSARSPEEIERVLRCSVGFDASATRMFLMFSGGDDFVRGDAVVTRFVANALGREVVCAEDAEALVRRAAHELILSPRFLDRGIWTFGTTLLSAE